MPDDDATLPGPPARVPAPDDPGPRAGDRFGRYVLERRIGAGAMGQVWAAFDEGLHRRVAIKVIGPRVAGASELAARLVREARALAKVEHPHVVTVYDAATEGDRVFVAMQLLDGQSLGERQRARTPGAPATDWRAELALLLDAGAGLAAAHRAGITHRDFKPDNVFLDRSAGVKVVDFGLAALDVVEVEPLATTLPAATSGGLDRTAAALTAVGALLGTPLYMAPEQLVGAAAAERSDQFAFCVTAWELLYGSRPFLATGPTLPAAISSLAESIAQGPPAQPPSGVPAALHRALARGLSADPAARWPSMDALLAALRAAAARRARRQRWLVGAAVPAIASGVAIAVVLGGAQDPPAPTRTPSGAAAPPRIEARLRWDATLNTESRALSPDGRWLVGVAGGQVIALDLLDGTRRSATVELPPRSVLQFVDDETVLIPALTAAGRELVRWNLARETLERSPLPGGDAWIGQMRSGDVRAEGRPGVPGRTARFSSGAVVSTTGVIIDHAVAPDGAHLALLEEVDRFHSRVIVVDDQGRETQRTEPIAELSAMSWRSADEVLLATGVSGATTITTLRLGAAALSLPLYTGQDGWIGDVLAGGPRIVVETLRNADVAALWNATAEPSPDVEGRAILAWAGPDEVSLLVHGGEYAIPHAVSTGGRLPSQAVVPVDGDVANATRAAQVLILSLRAPGGRRVVARDAATGDAVWRVEPGTIVWVRCALDLAPPCIAASHGATPHLRWIDPQTGVLGDDLGVEGELTDGALSEGGHELAWIVGDRTVWRRTTAGGEARQVDAPRPVTRSITFAADGELYASTSSDDADAKRFIARATPAGWVSVVATSGQALVQLLRASPDASQLSYRVRRWDSSLGELVGLPPPGAP